MKYNFSVFLIKSSIRDLNKIIDMEKPVEKLEIDEKFDFNGHLFLGKNESNLPPWNNFLEEGIVSYQKQGTLSARAVLLIEYAERIFAFSFGYGRYMLNHDSYERGFGFKVVLNNASAGSIRSVDTSIFDEKPLNSTIQSTESVLLEDFNITDVRTMFKAITAEGTDKKRYGSIIEGRDSFHFQRELNFENLPEICGYLLDDFKSEKYKETFPDLGKIEQINDPSKIEELDKILLEKFSKGEIAQFYLPEIVRWDLVKGFYFTPMGPRNEDLSTERFWSEKRIRRESLTIKQLKRQRLFLEYTTEELDTSWSIYNCLQTQLQKDGEVLLFSVGEWFKVEESFIDEVDSFIENLPKCALDFPIFNGEYEKEINEIISSQVDGVLNMDMDNIRIDGSQYEVCDLFTSCKRFIHIKWWDRSATLSHLFSQGRVSAGILLGDWEQRNKLKKKIEELDSNFAELIDVNNYHPADYTVVFAVIYPGKKTFQERLPFFSKINLKHNAQMIQNLNYGVEIKHIETHRKRKSKKKNEN